MLSIDTCNELVARRRNAVAQGNASLRAEGIAPPPEIEIVVDRWVRGEISTAEMEQQVAALYSLPE